jgi:transporter family-2 protein
MSWLASLFAFVSGALITVQAGSNSQLKKSLGVPMPAVIVNYLVGITSIALYMLWKRDPLPALSKASQVPWWGWGGGLFGAAYGVAAVILASQLGAATLTALVVTGQLICSVILDHFGWVGFDPHPANVWRILGCVLMTAGLVLIGKF